MTAIEDIKQFRLKVDYGCKWIQATTSWTTKTGYRELSETNLRRSKNWLGEMMGVLGSLTPYTPSDTVEDIVPRQEVKEFNESLEIRSFNQYTQELEKIRAYIADLEKEFIDVQNIAIQASIVDDTPPPYRMMSSINSINQYLTEARHDLGEELGHIKLHFNQPHLI